MGATDFELKASEPAWIPVVCNNHPLMDIHPLMNAWVFALDHPSPVSLTYLLKSQIVGLATKYERNYPVFHGFLDLAFDWC